MKSLDVKMVAPCGINCGVCKGHLREKNPCHGCRKAEENYPKTRVNCKIRTCSIRKGDFCFECREFPCDRLKHLDDRYQARYDMSEIENLEFIRAHGIKEFIESENKKWLKGDLILCVHDRKLYKVKKEVL